MKQINEKLLSYQASMLRAKEKYLAIIGGTGVGKTFFLPRYLLFKMQKYPGHKWIVCAPTVQMLRNNPISYIITFFDSIGLRYDFNKSYMTMQCRFGTIHFISCETPDRMQGVHAKGIICDEAGMVSRLWWETAIQRVTFQKGQILLITTPYSHNWLKTDVYDEFLAGNKDFYIENPTCLANPYYPIEEYLRAKKRLPKWKFDMLYRAMFTKVNGLIYENYTTVEPFVIPDNWNIMRSIDFGFNNPLAVVWMAENPNTGEKYIFKEHKKSGCDIDQIDELLQKDQYSQSITYGDPENQEVMNTLKRRGVRIRNAKKDVMAGILLVNDLLKNKNVKIFSTCKHVIDELNTYQWETDKTGEFIDKPRKYNDHLMDSLRYLLYTSTPKESSFYNNWNKKRQAEA